MLSSNFVTARNSFHLNISHPLMTNPRSRALCDLVRIINRATHGQGTFIHLCAQFFTVEQLGNDKRRAFVFTDIVDGEDIRVIERGSGAGSCSKRRSRSAFLANSEGNSLIATSRPRRSSRDRYTSPIPPAPM